MKKIGDLDFADDIALTAESIEDLKALTTSLEKAAANVGLKICQNKTESHGYTPTRSHHKYQPN